MPSFDIVSEVDMHEATNAVDQANREVTNRFDFKGTGCKYEIDGTKVTLVGQSDFHIKQMMGILEEKLVKRSVDIRCLEAKDIQVNGQEARQEVTIKQGLETDMAKKIVKLVKGAKLKVQASIQGEQVRVSGKKRDDLQETIAFMKEQKLPLPLQYINFRD